MLVGVLAALESRTHLTILTCGPKLSRTRFSTEKQFAMRAASYLSASLMGCFKTTPGDTSSRILVEPQVNIAIFEKRGGRLPGVCNLDGCGWIELLCRYVHVHVRKTLPKVLAHRPLNC